MEELDAAADAATARIDAAGGGLERHVETLRDAASRAAEAMDRAGLTLEARGGAIGDVADSALARIEAAGAALRARGEDVAATSEAAGRRLGDTVSTLGAASERLTAAADEAQGRVLAVEGALGDQAQRLRAAVELAGRLAADAAETLRARAADFETQTADAATRMEAAGLAHREGMRATTDAAVAALADLDAVCRTLEARAASLDDAMARAVEAGEDVAARGARIEDAADRSAQRIAAIGAQLAAHAALLADASARGDDVMAAAAEKLRVHGESLVAAAEAARRAADDLTATELDRRRGGFLKSSRAVVDGLNGLAIDLSRSLSPTLPEKLMSAFVAGDRGVFVRRVLSMDLGGDAPLLRAKYRDDPVFRGHVDAYVRQFESLRAASVAADPDAILTAAFLTSDIGKLYMFLAAAIERPDAAGLPPPGA
jgi:hypothetical protein